MRYDGTVTAIDARREAVRRFQNEPTRVFVANPAAAGAGLTLHAARYAVYESFTNQAAHYLQSLDRIHRRGQSREVEYLMLLAESSIEPLEFDRLVVKEELAPGTFSATWSTPPLPANGSSPSYVASTRTHPSRMR